uniref:catalase n=1 Tax=Hydrogenophaga pseudoflava TaxID=47421 RepID=UPI0035B01032
MRGQSGLEQQGAGRRGAAARGQGRRGADHQLYTEEGNWDLVGNNMPVFFIQDAMKFPDLVRAVKPEPDSGVPTAASAHDTFCCRSSAT